MSCEFCGVDTSSGGSGDFQMQAFTKYCNNCQANIDKNIIGKTKEVVSQPTTDGFNIITSDNNKKRKREDDIIKVVFKIGDSDPYSYIKYIKKDELTLKLLMDFYRNEFKVEKEIVLVCNYNKYRKSDYVSLPDDDVIITEENLNYLISEVDLFCVEHITKKFYCENVLDIMK